MMRRLLPTVCLLAALLTTLVPAGVLTSVAQDQSAALSTPAHVSDMGSADKQGSPFMFIENVGQFDEAVRYQAYGGKYTVWLVDDGLWIALTRTRVESEPETSGDSLSRRLSHLNGLGAHAREAVHLKFSFPGANTHPLLKPFDPLSTRVSYFLGSNPAGWRVGVPVWGAVRYVDIYPGIDLEVAGGDSLIFRMVARTPQADLNAVRLQVDGAESLILQDVGDSTGHVSLRIGTKLGCIALSLLGIDNVEGVSRTHSPQLMGEEISSPNAGDLLGSKVAAAYSDEADMPGDLVYATYLGGQGADRSHAIAVDGIGRAYVTGITDSTDFPAVHGPGYDNSFSGGLYDAFVVRLNPSGTSLEYATFLGGGDYDEAIAIAVDGDGNAYVTGDTNSSNFPAAHGPGYDTSFNGSGDGFVVKLDPSGTGLQYATFLGGSGIDWSMAIAVGEDGNAYLVGLTSSSNFPAVYGPGYDTTFNGGSTDAFAVQLNPSGTGLEYATFLGGSDADAGTAIALDRTGSVYMSGSTHSTDFPAFLGPGYDTSFNGQGDGFVVKLNPSGTALEYATFLGGSQLERAFRIAADGLGSTYVTGETYSSDFPAARGPGYDTSFNGGTTDAFVVKLNPSGTGLEYATFLGGSDFDEGQAIAVGRDGHAHVTGSTFSSDFPAVHGPGYDTSFNGGTSDAFSVKLNPSGTGLQYATFLGGSASGEGALAVALDATGNVYVAGVTRSSDFPAAYSPGYDNSFNGYEDGFALKLGLGAGPEPTPIVFVHGWGGLPPWGSCAWPDPDDYFQSVDNDLAAYYYVEYAQLETSPCYTPPLVENVPRLETAIAEAKAATDQEKVILIAHSMGGLVSRAYLEDESAFGHDVEALFTFGTPHLGVPEDLLVFFANGVSLGEYCEGYQPAACDFSVLGMVLFNRDHPNRAADVEYHLTSGDAPFSPRTALAKAAYVLLGDGDDGAVQTASGIGLDGMLDRWTTDEVHGPNSGPRSYFIRDGGPSRSYTECLRPVLVDGATDICGDFGTLDVRAAAAPGTSQHTPFEFGTLLSGETATRAVSLEGGPTLFASQWQTETVEFTLLDPSDQVVDPAYAANHPELVTYDADTTSAVYEILNADAGVWKMVLSASSVPVDGSSYTMFTAFDSALQLTADTDQDWYQPGTTATISAALSDPAASAALTATVLYADGVTATLTLSPQAAGQYEGTYVVHDAPGYAEVRVAAAGITAGGTPMERGLVVAFQVSPDSVALTDTYSDAPELRSPGSPYYKALVVTVGIDSAIEGAVGLSADLRDPEGAHVAHSLAITDVVPGEVSLRLRFDGDDIYASEKDGPYTLTNLLLTDRRGSTLVVLEAEDVYTTGYYDYQSFGMAKVYLPLILRQAP